GGGPAHRKPGLPVWGAAGPRQGHCLLLHRERPGPVLFCQAVQMSGLGWPVLSFSLASGAALGCLFLLFRGFSRLLGLKKLGTALLDVLFGGLAGGFVFLCALAVDSGRLRLYQVLPQALGAWAAVTALGPWTRRGAGALQKIFCRL